MKTLILVRHAKSSWEFDVIDHERPLNNRGFNDADLVSKVLKMSKLKVDKLISSDAVRAKTTAEFFIENLPVNKNIVSYDYDLYDFSGESLVKVIQETDDSVDELMVFGHNHAITHFANTYGSIYIENVPTCGVVIFQFDIETWNTLKLGKTIKTLFPKDLK
ncbi:histidine phosphatase family protein [Tamlana fucoidanivorans]|uniref:Histidine phosphatase family protein n=1 Tax=Allotamlana fucoidanivorans TaxID=2583814 RepID=A0A5C4SFJ0_9FLAO|nr:histidine phosphatase family protein [Tamlana fucoidanivorans]TNJ41722.1 histidine phosphatase family protein [Tamlana fucoidanivorans]